MAFLQAYFDESGKQGQSKVVSFAGLVTVDWEPFENEWNFCLRKHRIPALHLSKESLTPTTSLLARYRNFIQVITKSVEHGFCAAVDTVAFNALHKSVKTALGGDPHYLAVRVVMMDLIKYADMLPNPPSVALICDDDEQKACKMYELYRQFRGRNVDLRGTLKSIAFADDTFYPQLQAADLFAWVSRAEALHRIFGQDFRLRSLYTEFTAQLPGARIGYTAPFLDKDELEKFGARTQKDLARLYRQRDIQS